MNFILFRFTGIPERYQERESKAEKQPHDSLKMNAFRLAGDMLHLVSILMMLLKITSSKSVNGQFRSLIQGSRA